jgi:hypothetical protein
MEVGAQTRKLLLQKKVKLGWLICNIDNYLVPNRYFKCSRFNYMFGDCKGEGICPLCSGSHTLKECTATPSEYKCINCLMLNKHNQNKKKSTITTSHCPRLQAILEKYRQNTDY